MQKLEYNSCAFLPYLCSKSNIVMKFQIENVQYLQKLRNWIPISLKFVTFESVVTLHDDMRQFFFRAVALIFELFYFPYFLKNLPRFRTSQSFWNEHLKPSESAADFQIQGVYRIKSAEIWMTIQFESTVFLISEPRISRILPGLNNENQCEFLRL